MDDKLSFFISRIENEKLLCFIIFLVCTRDELISVYKKKKIHFLYLDLHLEQHKAN